MSGNVLVVVPVILAGGSGTRLWPLSRALHPKQYLSLGVGNSDATLFQQAAQRIAAIGAAGIAVQPPCVVANEEHRFTVVEQLRHVGIEPARVLLEPLGRNTAPALTLAAMEAVNASGEAYLSHTTVNGRAAIRLAVGSWRTTLADVDRTWRALQEAAAALG